MNLVSGLVAVGVLSVASNALGADAASQVVARADASAPLAASAAQQPALAEVAGRYETDSGLTILVVGDGDSMSIEWPQGLGFDAARLRSDETGDFFVAETAALVTFERDRDGGVTGMTVYPPGADAAVFAVKKPMPRGVVKIYDVNAPLRRGIVTIFDIVDAPATLTVAAAD